MNLHGLVLAYIRAVVAEMYPGAPLDKIALVKPSEGGDIATNAAFVISQHLKARSN